MVRKATIIITGIITPLRIHFLQQTFDCRNQLWKYSFGLAVKPAAAFC
jgi:hypothetical protein